MTNKPLIFGSHLGNFAAASDPLWLGWRGDDGRIDLKICENDLREAANAGANATSLFKPTFELKVGDNLWDVSQFNPAEFDDTRGVIALCHKCHIQPWVTLWFNHGKGPWTFNVYGLKDPYSSVELSEAYVQRVVAELGPDVCYRIICEPLYKGKWADKNPIQVGSCWYWLAKMIEKLWACGVPAENIMYGPELKYTVDGGEFNIDDAHKIYDQAAEVVRIDLKKQGWTLDAINKKLNAGWQDQHTCARAGEVMDGVTWPIGRESQFVADMWGKATSLRRCMASDDGARIKPADGERWSRPSPQQQYISAKGLMQYPFPKGLAIEVLGYKHNDEIYRQLEAVSQAVFDATGERPDNYGKFPKPEVPPVEPPIPPVIINDDKPKITWQGKLALALIVAAVIVAAVLIIA
jgi:hypothetical protein